VSRTARASAIPRFALPASIPAALLVGAAAGALWGVVARGWMRFISAEYEFTWGGTLAIVAIFAIFGFGQAIAAVVRRSECRPRSQIAGRVVAIATTVPLGMAAGAMMLPSTVAAVALGRDGMHPRARLAVATLAAIPTLFVLRQLVSEIDLWRAVIGWVSMFVVYLPLVWAVSRAIRPFARLAPPHDPLSVDPTPPASPPAPAD